MAKINVTLNAFYGYGCSGCGYGSNDSIEVEITNAELDAIREINASEVSRNAIMEVLESGNSLLESLHDRLDEECYYMVEEYWLFEADNECLNESLAESMEKDLGEEIYTHPVSFDEFVEQLKTGEIKLENKDLGYLKELGLEDEYEYDFEDEEDLQYKYRSYLWDKYYDWICEHDHEFIAERVGLDIDACRDDEIDYTIHL